MANYHIHIEGQVQGVGFRPFVYQLAHHYHLTGWVSNGVDGVHIEVSGAESLIADFYQEILHHPPLNSRIIKHSIQSATEGKWPNFSIRKSIAQGKPNLLLTPDLGICPECRDELHRPDGRRYNYAFTTCLQCGPRYSIIKGLPYDRPYTSMDQFQMCPSCEKEYNDPKHRRFYSQTNSCPDCTVHLSWHNKQGEILTTEPSEVISNAIAALHDGKILAVKGIGGYLLMADATSESTIHKLRERKNRPVKPFALLYPNQKILAQDVYLGKEELEEWKSMESPIVLFPLRPTPPSGIQTEAIAPGLGRIGVMQPYAPLLELLATGFGKPLIATSGNRSGFPIFYQDKAALKELAGIADCFLVNDREIVVPQDDSVVGFSGLSKQRTTILTLDSRWSFVHRLDFGHIADIHRYLPLKCEIGRRKAEKPAGNPHFRPISDFRLPISDFPSACPKSKHRTQPQPILSNVRRIPKQRVVYRRSRGLAPNFVHQGFSSEDSYLSMGAELKSTFGLHHAGNTYISQYLGDTGSFDVQQSYKAVQQHLIKLLHFQPAYILTDLHPDYFSTREGERIARMVQVPVISIQHHVAHFGAVLAENQLFESHDPVLGVVWDGTGYGEDGAIWGGEFFTYRQNQIDRTDHFTYYPHLSGDKMAAEPRLCALSLLGTNNEASNILRQKFTHTEWKLYTQLQSRANRLQTSSVGRLFDAVASLLGICDKQTFEGEAAMQLQRIGADWYRAHPEATKAYPINRPDTQGILQAILRGLQSGESPGAVSARFHLTLVRIIREMAAREKISRIAFSGGVFQNTFLLDLIRTALQNDFGLYFHQELSPNDENIAYGQLAIAIWQQKMNDKQASKKQTQLIN